MSTVLIPLPATDFDPSETAIPWQILEQRGHRVVFASPDGLPARCDQRMLDGRGLGPWSAILRASLGARQAYVRMQETAEFRAPMSWAATANCAFDGLLLPGGHAPGMRAYLESPVLQHLVLRAFDSNAPVAAICHGVLLVARTLQPDGRSVLCGRRCTALLRSMELTAWALTALWLGNYYRTYRRTVQAEVTAALRIPTDFLAGPLALKRDDPAHLQQGFVVRDGHLLTARWPGDAHRLAVSFAEMLEASAG